MADTVPIHEGLFTADPEAHLIGGKCQTCGRHQFPRSSLCPYCGGDDVAEALLSPTGTLWAWTAVTAAPPGHGGELPYGFAVVELPEGLRVITRLTESDPGKLRFGQAVSFELVLLHKNDE